MDEFDTFDGQPLRWKNKDGMHAVEGAEVHKGITLLWPKCGRGDVPANKAWTGRDEVTCPHCIETIKRRKARERLRSQLQASLKEGEDI